MKLAQFQISSSVNQFSMKFPRIFMHAKLYKFSQWRVIVRT